MPCVRSCCRAGYGAPVGPGVGGALPRADLAELRELRRKERRCLSQRDRRNTQDKRRCRNHGESGNAQGKGGVLTMEAVETYKAKAVY